MGAIALEVTLKRALALGHGEFVVRAASARQAGALEFLHEFNRFGMAALRPIQTGAPRFAGGGVIADAPQQTGAGGRLVIGLDEGLVLKAIESPRGQKMLVELVGRNRRVLQRVLEG